MTKRTVTFDGVAYKIKSDKVEIPNLDELDRIGALMWLNQNTYARGRSTVRSNPLAGYGGKVVTS